MPTAVKLFVIEAMRNTVALSTGARVATSRSPTVPRCAIRPSTMIA
jgi:hypothetical protein